MVVTLLLPFMRLQSDDDGKEFVSELMVSGLSRTFGAGLFDLGDVDLNSLGFAPAIALKGGGTS